MTDKKRLDSVNKEIAELCSKVNLDSRQFSQPYWLHEGQISEDKRQIDEVRRKLRKFRSFLDNERQTRNILALQNRVNDILCNLTELSPLNKLTEAGEFMCPVNHGRVIRTGEEVALSNGCLYDREALGQLAKGEKYFPRKLLGSDVEISQQDVQLAQKYLKARYVATGLGFSTLVGIGVEIAILASNFFGYPLSGIFVTALVTLGLAPPIALGVSIGLVVAGLVGILVAGALIGAKVFANHHPTQLDPSLAPQAGMGAKDINERLGSDELDATKSPKPTPAVTPKADEAVSSEDNAAPEVKIEPEAKPEPALDEAKPAFR